MIGLFCAMLATYRVATDIATENGPGNLFAHIRRLLLPWLGDGVACPVCVSFWLALPASVAAVLAEPALDPLLWPLWWLAVAGGARLLWKVEP